LDQARRGGFYFLHLKPRSDHAATPPISVHRLTRLVAIRDLGEGTRCSEDFAVELNELRLLYSRRARQLIDDETAIYLAPDAPNRERRTRSEAGEQGAVLGLIIGRPPNALGMLGQHGAVERQNPVRNRRQTRIATTGTIREQPNLVDHP